MTRTISAHFDGKVIIPDEPVELPVGRSLQLVVELSAETTARFADLLCFAADLPDAPSDLGAQHDHYLYGNPKR